MLTTTVTGVNATVTRGRDPSSRNNEFLIQRYQNLINNKRLHWATHHRLERLLGSGGQGVVYLTERRGADGFTLPVAIKIFSPDRYEDERAYDDAMQRIADVAAHVAQIQHDNLLDVHNFVDRDRIRMMVMEWVDGFDLEKLLVADRLARVEARVSQRRWEYINRVIVTAGPAHPRFKAGVAMAVMRGCLGALAALHREGIVHGDIKPSNVMLKRTGTAKIVDTGSAFALAAPPPSFMCTPHYAAPEVLENSECTPRSDLASLGYVFIEMLAGQSPFANCNPKNLRELLEFKRSLPHRLHYILPEEVTVNELLMNFCRRLIAPDPMQRFPNAEEADLVKEGAAAFLRQLVLSNLAVEYENEIRVWLEELRELDELDHEQRPSTES
ncbi:MAG: serine/threonine protein kinase [Planctomycetaceae bacterium]|mgnify:FL=1|nr:serine/threonine protein kinase [Planctomycetaceae bacterium]